MRRASPAGRGRCRDLHLGGASATPLPACNSPPFAAASAVGFPASLAAGTDLRPAAPARRFAPAASAGSSSPPGDLGRVQIEGVVVWFLSHSPRLMDGSTHLFMGGKSGEGQVGRLVHTQQCSRFGAVSSHRALGLVFWATDRRVAHIYRSRTRGGAEGVI
jgi:hypothetical protein